MRAVMARLSLWAAALWWGSLSTLGFLVVPLLFVHLPTPALAGGMAAKLFTAQTWVSTVCAVLLLLVTSRPTEAGAADEGAVPLPATSLYVIGGLLLALLAEFAVAPHIVARENLALWHRLGSAMYFLQWGCAAMTFWQLVKRRT